jgi:cholesterol transport system auxiliary component
MKPFISTLAGVLLSGCVSQRALPIRYDLDGTRAVAQASPRFDATIAIPAIQAPSWLRSTALVYRLDYAPPAYPRAYALSEWAAPPGELLTVRLRERIAAVNEGFTLDRLSEDTDGYRLEVSLENFAQVFTSPDRSRCIAILKATVLQPGDRVVAQRTFRSEQSAPSGNAAGAVEGLAAASDSDFAQILKWLRGVLPTQQASARTGAIHGVP